MAQSASYNFTDYASGFLQSPIASNITAFSLASGQGAMFSASNFIAYIQDECIIVGARATDSLSSVTRGANATQAVSHGDHEVITERYTKLHNDVSISNFNDLYGIPTISGLNLGAATGAGAGDMLASGLIETRHGTWTPTFVGSVTAGVFTYTFQVGTYLRIGNLVTFHARVAISAIGTPPVGAMVISGLPFAAADGEIHSLE